MKEKSLDLHHSPVTNKPLSCLLWGLRVGAGELVEDGNEDPRVTEEAKGLNMHAHAHTHTNTHSCTHLKTAAATIPTLVVLHSVHQIKCFPCPNY